MKRHHFHLSILLVILAVTAGIVIGGRSFAAEPFGDVNKDNPYSEAILYLKNTKIIGGYPDGTFKPGNRMNRAEFMKVIIGAAYSDASGSNCFPDVKNEWFAPYICEGKRRGIVAGYPDGAFKPSNTISFVEAAKIMAITFKMELKTEGIEQWYQPYVEALQEKSAIPESVELFNEEIVRDELAEMIYRVKVRKTNKVSRSYAEIKERQEESYRVAKEPSDNGTVGAASARAIPASKDKGKTESKITAVKNTSSTGGGGGGNTGGGGAGGGSVAAPVTTPTTPAPTPDTTPSPDTTAPTVAFTSPGGGATVSGEMTITATASDDVGISSVELKVDGVVIATNTSSPYSTTYNTTTVTNGTYTLFATAKDAAGNEKTVTRSITINNVVPDTTAPTAAFTSPANGATVSGTITLTATASDNVGVSSVQLKIGSTLIATDTTAPYSTTYSTTGVANGTYTLSAIARDTAGNETTVTRNITVNNNTVAEAPGMCSENGLAAIPSCDNASYYVDASAGNDSNAGTSAAPWQTLLHARAQAPNNATVCVRNGNYGTYSETSPPSGNKTHVFRAATGHSPVISKILVKYSSLQAANLTFSGFAVSSTSQELVTIADVSNLRLSGLRIEGHTWPGIDGMSIYDAADVVVDGTLIQNIARGIQVGDTLRPRFLGNHIVPKGGTGIQYLNGNIAGEIAYNNIHGGDWSTSEPNAPSAPHASVISLRSGDVTIRGNHLHSMGSTSGIMFYPPDSVVGEDAYNDILIENNAIYDIDNTYVLRFYNLGSNVVLRNNTIWQGYRAGNCSDGVTSDARYRYNVALIVHNQAEGGMGMKLYNNVFAGMISAPLSSVAEERNNVIWSWNARDDGWLSTSPSGSSTIFSSSYTKCEGSYNPVFENGTFFQGTIDPFFPGRGEVVLKLTPSATALYTGDSAHQPNASLGSLSDHFVSFSGSCRESSTQPVGAYTN